MGIGSIVGGVIGGIGRIGAAGDAGKALIGAYEDQMRYYNEAYDRNRPLYDPYIKVGQGGLQDIRSLQDQGYFTRQFGANDIYNDPSYKFRMAQANALAANQFNARGGFQGGNTAQGLAAFNQDLASTEYGNAFNRFQAERTNTINRLNTIANIGSYGVSGATSLDRWRTEGVSAGRIGVGQAHANAILGAANARSDVYTGIGAGVDALVGVPATTTTGTGPWGSYSTQTPATGMGGWENVYNWFKPR